MTGATPQMLDLMLGPAVPSPDGLPAGGDSAAVGDGPLFANLLGGFLEGQPLTQNGFDLQQLLAGGNPRQPGTPGLPNLVAETEVESLIRPGMTPELNNSDGLSPAIGDASIESPDPGKSFSARPTDPGLSHLSQRLDRESMSTTNDPLIDNLSLGIDRTADKLDKSLALLQEAATIRNQSLKEIFTGGQVKVKPGSYKVIDSEVSKGQLNLTVVSSESSTDQIKLSLPLKTLFQEGSLSTGRTALSGSPSSGSSLMDGPVLEDYISKLRLTSLEVELSAPTAAKQSVLKLFSGTGERQLVMLSQLDGNGLVGKLRQSRTDKVGGGSVDIDEALLDPRSTAETPVGRSAAQPWNDTLLNRLHQFAGKQDQKLTMMSTVADSLGENTETARMNELIGPDTKIERSSADGDGLKTRAARFSLPEDVRTALRPGGHSVTLRIEPEHLGPARLRLVMHNNMLRALVTVDSTQAKLVLEGSLDQLTNQLSKAGIDVERIEVALNSDSRQESFQHRRPRRQTSLKSERGVDAAPAVMTTAVSEDRYGVAPKAGAGGVDLLA